MFIIIKEAVIYTEEDKKSGLTFKHILGIDIRGLVSGSNYIKYEVIDKQIFMLAVIKYGIEFEEIKCSTQGEKLNSNHE